MKIGLQTLIIFCISASCKTYADNLPSQLIQVKEYNTGDISIN
ncbi:Uncharacterised protein [Acinetobacter junii]|nr:hypothetical protein F948_02501 [Acinetobacter junii CIP 64.5]SUU06207.1 Uncharacterised protein [Acinetobacter junii]SUU08667.1 Uncharacterised protein [Acinetobacter junii]